MSSLSTSATHPHARDGMEWVPGGSFLMGSDDFYPEESPARSVTVTGFWMDRHPVTVADFGRFVDATDYVTVAERPLDPADFPGADPATLVPGSLVFRPTDGPVDLRDWRKWWRYVPGACWRHPDGPDTGPSAPPDHPVVHVAYEDAVEYASWAGKALPTEAEWERAARGGLDGMVYAWGDEFAPGGRMMANTWQGRFPWENLLEDGHAGTSPVGCFPPNGFGLYDMTGNVWEWTADSYSRHHAPESCCGPPPPTGEETTGDAQPRVVKGGSHLCAPSYCLRYRPAARQGEAADTSTGHIGFRCVVRDGS